MSSIVQEFEIAKIDYKHYGIFVRLLGVNHLIDKLSVSKALTDSFRIR